MKRLTLLRHAKSGDDGTVARDFDRPLNAKGRRAARAIGRHLRAQGAAFDAVIASPALRVVETIEEVGHGRAAAIEPRWERRIYLASVAELLDLVRATPDSVASLLLVGHNPGLEELVLTLVPDRAEDIVRDKVEEKYPTASLAEIALPIAHWADVGAGIGELAAFTRPRDLDPRARAGHAVTVPTLRRATPADAEALNLLGGATFLAAFAHDHPGAALLAHVRSHHAPEWYKARLADPVWAIWLIETPLGAPIGYAVAGPPNIDFPTSADDLELLRLYALPGWQGAGLGRMLLAAVEAEARARRAKRLLLCVYTANAGAQRFYAREGFADTGRRQTFMVGDVAFEDLIWAKPMR